MRDARQGMSRSKQRTGGGGRTIGFGLIAVLVALLVAYLGRCLPGFGTGGAPSSGPTCPEAPAAERATQADPEQGASAPETETGRGPEAGPDRLAEPKSGRIVCGRLVTDEGRS